MVHLLTVDDEPNVASLLVLLGRNDYQTTVTYSGHAALEMLCTASFALSLLDLNAGS